ncbi:MAG: DUF6036 family nucleotidyltransferase [Solirubrobacteraceae bacterium]|nr:MAG: hypothetical protein DLM63_05695 [Solirubrobacterales bacterium]
MSGSPDRALDLRELFRLLAAGRVDYVVIGGVAAQVHGRRRTTKDLDIMPAPDDANLDRLARALAELEARPAGLAGASAPTPTPEQLRHAAIVPPLATHHGELHICNSVPGAAPYQELRARALVTDLDGIPVAIVSVDDLIAMKHALGRPGDIEDIAALTALAREGTAAGA